MRVHFTHCVDGRRLCGLHIWQTWFQTFSQHPRLESDGLNLVGTLDRLVTETSSNVSFSQYSRTYPNCYRSKRMLGDTAV